MYFKKKMPFSDRKFLIKDPRKTQEPTLTKAGAARDKDSVSLVDSSTILDEIFAYSSKTFAMEKTFI